MIKIGNIDFTDEKYIIDIRDKSQVIKARVVMPDDAVYGKYLMKKDDIQFSFEYDSLVSFMRGDYIEYDGARFVLDDENPSVQENTQKFVYSLVFQADYMLLKNTQMYYVRQNLKEVSWSLTSDAASFIKIAVDNANRYFNTTDWQVGTVEPTGMKYINFDSTSVLDALTQIAEQFDAEWYITGKTINLVNKLSYGSEIDFESEVSVVSMARSEGENSTKFNRIVALGSTRNISANYRQTTPTEGVDAIYQKRLRIPASKGDVIDAYPNMSPEEVIEGSVIFDDVYPQRTGTMSDITTKEYIDTDEETGVVTKWHAYRYKDTGLSFKESDILPGQELRIVFQSGKPNGMDFAVKFNPDDYPETDARSQVFEIVRSEDYGAKLPNDVIKPENGDKYILYGFDIQLVSDQYVTAAEQELYDKALEWLKDNLKDKSVYTCPSIINHFADNSMNLDIGQKVRLANGRFENGYRSSRIMGFEKKLNNKYDAVYTVGDNASYSRLAAIEKEIKELQIAGVSYSNNGRGNVYVIKQFDSTRPSDFNVYSAKATDAKYFNKQTGGTIQGDTVFQKNTQTQGVAISDVFQNSTFTAGQFGSGFQLKRDVNGQSYLEIDNLMVRRETVFNKLTIAEIKSIGGTILLSLANMVVSGVEDKTSSWKCLFDTATNTIPNDFAVSDQVICRKYTGQDTKYYWALITAVGADYIELSKTDKDGLGVPSVGDELIQFGNRSDVNRQYAIMLSAYGSDAPSIKQYAGINSYDLTNKEVTAISPKGNKFTGSFIVSNNGTSKPVYKEEGLFVNGNTYYLNDRVSYLGSYWVCLVDKTVKVPNEESNDWRKDTIGQPDIDKVQKEYESQFLILDTNIASKVSKTDFDALGNRVSKTESSITQLSNSITSVVETVGKLPIIGRNLIIRHNELEKTMINTDGSVVTYYANSTMADPISVTGGEVLSFSKYGDFLPSDSNWRYAYYKEDGTLITRKGIGTDIFKEAVPSEAKFLRVSYPSKWKVKIERGNKVTEWSESPEDAAYKNRTYYQDTIPTVPSGGHIEGDLWYMKSLVDSSGNINADTSKNTYQMQYRWNGTTWQQVNWSVSKSKIEQTDNSISSIVEKTGIDSIGEGETLLSKIKQSESSIESIVQKTGVNGVSDGNTLLSMIKQTNDNITLEVSKIKIGATNLLLNSSFSNGVKPWSGQGTHAISVDTSVLFNNNNTLKIISTGDGNPSGATNRFLTLRDVAEGDHLFSFYAKADKPCTLRTRINNIIRDFAITTEWKRFVRPEAHRDDNIICWLTSSATMWLACPQIEAGNKVTDWRVSSDDIVDEIKAGIQIEADGISLFGEKFTVNSLLIAKAIETQALNVGGNTTINKDGTISICNGKILLNADGSGQLANGNIIWDKNGNVTVKGKIESNTDGNKIVIDSESRSFKMLSSDGVTMMNMIFEDSIDNGISSQIMLSQFHDGVLRYTSFIRGGSHQMNDHQTGYSSISQPGEISFRNHQNSDDISFSARKTSSNKYNKDILNLRFKGIPIITSGQNIASYIDEGQVYITNIDGRNVLCIR